jgi:hypothetical protein
MLRNRLWMACVAAISCWYVLLPVSIAIEPVEIKPLPVPPAAATLQPMRPVEQVAPPVITSFCNLQPLYLCLKAPYCGKPGPCPPPCDYAKCCVPYCSKPLPCPPSPCQQWCPDLYCPKPPVCCFPGNPCGHCDTCAKHGCLHHGKK